MRKRQLDVEWHLRPSRASDGHFLINSWLKAFQEILRPYDRRKGYWKAQKILIMRTLEDPHTRVFVAANDENDDDILGYAVGRPGADLILDYVYVKQKHRRAGVANALIAALRAQCRPDPRAKYGPNVICTHTGVTWVRRKIKERGWSPCPRGALYDVILALWTQQHPEEDAA